jgi:hypothetical protein
MVPRGNLIARIPGTTSRRLACSGGLSTSWTNGGSRAVYDEIRGILGAFDRGELPRAETRLPGVRDLQLTAQEVRWQP